MTLAGRSVGRLVGRPADRSMAGKPRQAGQGRQAKAGRQAGLVGWQVGAGLAGGLGMLEGLPA